MSVISAAANKTYRIWTNVQYMLIYLYSLLYFHAYTSTQQGDPGTPGAVGVRGIVGIPVSPPSFSFIAFPNQKQSVKRPFHLRLVILTLNSSAFRLQSKGNVLEDKLLSEATKQVR